MSEFFDDLKTGLNEAISINLTTPTEHALLANVFAV